MNRISVSAATAAFLACSIALGAQTSSANKPSPPRATRSARSSQTANPPQEITLTGCLQAGDQSAATASNTTTGATATRRAQANAIPTFILSSASPGSSPSSSEPRSVGTTGSEPSSSSSASLSGTGSGSYMLQGLDLSRQTGQQVEVTGTVMPAPTARAGRNPNASMPRIRVISVRMLSEHCSS